MNDYTVVVVDFCFDFCPHFGCTLLATPLWTFACMRLYTCTHFTYYARQIFC